MKKIILLGVAILAFVATGCNKENAENIKSNLITEMSISIEGSDTKVAVTPTASGLKYEWSGSESVWVFPAEAGQQTPILFSYNSSTGKFTSSPLSPWNAATRTALSSSQWISPSRT